MQHNIRPELLPGFDATTRHDPHQAEEVTPAVWFWLAWGLHGLAILLCFKDARLAFLSIF